MGKDAGLGPLGNVSANENGLSETSEKALSDAIGKFREEVKKLKQAQNNANAAVTALKSWVSLGEKALEIAGPIIDAKLTKPAAAAGAKPLWSERLTAKISEVNSIVAALQGLKPSGNG